MNSTGLAWAIAKGHKSGNKEEALNFLNTLSLDQYRAQNKAEGRVRARIRSKPLRVGDRPRKRWSV